MSISRIATAIAAAGALSAFALACAESLNDASPAPDASVDATADAVDAPPPRPDAPLDLPDAAPDAPSAASDAADAADASPPGDAGPDAPCAKSGPNQGCGLAPQCGCSASSTCEVNGANGDTHCATAGNFVEGQGCASTASCKAGLACIDGVCRAYCASLDAGCPTTVGTACVAFSLTGSTPTPNDVACRFDCELVTSAGCNPSGALPTMCALVGPGDDTDCVPNGTVDVNGDCTQENCKAGLVCASDQCTPICRMGHAPSDCAAGATCKSFLTPVTVRGAPYGYCD